MDLLRLTALLVFTYGAFSYAGILLLWLRQYGKAGWAGGPARTCGPGRRVELVGGAIALASFLWFVLNLMKVLTSLSPEIRQWPLDTGLLVLGFLFPPLIAHTTYNELGCKGAAPPVPPAWRRLLPALYAVSLFVMLFTLMGFYRVIDIPRKLTESIVNVSLGLLFGFVGVYSVLAISRYGARPRTRSESASRRSMLLLFGVMFFIFIPVTMTGLGLFKFTGLVYLVTHSLPLMFLFVGTYFDNRFEFFDLFIKRGLSLLVTIILLTAYFTLVAPRLEGLPLAWSRPWVYAVTLLPLAMALPWIYGKLSAWLDEVWLGRQFRTVEAVKHFLSGVQGAVTEEALVREAGKRIGEIFHAPVRVVIPVASAVGALEGMTLEIPIGRRNGASGSIQLGPRASQVPYFHQDVILLESLSEVFAYLLENVRLQHRKQEQEQREQELSLHASRSELKALRAQINPHFLFNALNAIAGLIPRDPARADRAVEQLAEVFRYTLRRSESEWTRLGEEMEAVKAYLDLEQARFGARLQCRVTVDPGVEDARIPTLIVQTLVENAVKHGVAAIRGPGRIEVEAKRAGEAVEIGVADNGPGFGKEIERARPESATSAGFGLKNIRDRLHGHFGDAASLEITRDEARQLTIVRLRIPPQPAAHEGMGDANSQERAALDAASCPVPGPAKIAP